MLVLLPVLGWVAVVAWKGSVVSEHHVGSRIQETRGGIRRGTTVFSEQAAERLRAGNLPALAAFLKEWHQCDPEAMQNWLRQMILSSPDKSGILLVASAQAGMPELALNESGYLPETCKEQVVCSIFDSLTHSDPPEAWERADSIEPEELRDKVRDIILTNAPDVNLCGLADLALGRERSATHDAVLQNVLGRWLREDPVEAASWINGKGVSQEIRDQVSLQLVYQCDGLDRSPETAMAWAEGISAVDQRYQAVGRAARELAAEDPDAAAASIRQSAVLTLDEKDSLLASLSQPPRDNDFPPPD